MDTHITRKIAINPNAKWLGHTWAIYEIENERKLPELVPYAYRINFETISIDYSYSVRVTTADIEHQNNGSETITAILAPQPDINGNTETYSIAGTNRTISSFLLTINKAGTNKKADCAATAYIASTAFNDEDCLQFLLFLNDYDFDFLVKIIKERNNQKFVFSAQQVDGL